MFEIYNLHISHIFRDIWAFLRERLRGVEAQGRGKHTTRPLPPKTVWGTPPTYNTIPPPPFVHAPSSFLEETGTDQTNPTVQGLPQWFWGAFSTSPPQNRTIRFAPPPPLWPFPNFLSTGQGLFGPFRGRTGPIPPNLKGPWLAQFNLAPSGQAPVPVKSDSKVTSKVPPQSDLKLTQELDSRRL